MNRRNWGASTNVLQILLDVFIVVAAFGADILIGRWNFELKEQLGFLLTAFVFMVILLLCNKAEYLYNVTLFCYLDRIIRKTSLSFMVAACVAAPMICFVRNDRTGAWFYLAFIGMVYVLLCLKAVVIRPLKKLYQRNYVSRVAFVGDKEKFDKFCTYLDKTSISYKSVGYISRNKEEYASNPDEYIGLVDDLESLIREHHIDEIYVGQDIYSNLELAQKYLDLCIEMGVTVRMIIDFYDRHTAQSYVTSVGTYPVVVFHTIALNRTAECIKRAVDIVGGVVGLILASPIMLVTAIAIKLDSPGPVFFKQTRVGKNGRQFKIYKFRSMYIDAEERKKELLSQNEIGGGVMFKIKDDPRITRVGKVIRKLSIDELPQFINVVAGSMSLVGTRPPTLDEVEKYQTNQWRRISIKPGLTGMWQVSGRSSIQDFEEIVKLDVEYIDNWSIWMDIKIMLKTVKVLLSHSDAY